MQYYTYIVFDEATKFLFLTAKLPTQGRKLCDIRRSSREERRGSVSGNTATR